MLGSLSVAVLLCPVLSPHTPYVSITFRYLGTSVQLSRPLTAPVCRCYGRPWSSHDRTGHCIQRFPRSPLPPRPSAPAPVPPPLPCAVVYPLTCTDAPTRPLTRLHTASLYRLLYRFHAAFIPLSCPVCLCVRFRIAVRTARTRNEQGARRSFSKNLIRTPTCTYTPAQRLCANHCADRFCIATVLATHQLVYPFPVCICAGQTSSRPTCAQNWSVSALHCQVF